MHDQCNAVTCRINELVQSGTHVSGYLWINENKLHIIQKDVLPTAHLSLINNQVVKLQS